MKALLPATAALLLAFNTHASDHPAPVQAAIAKGVKIEASFDTPAGLKGYAARINGDPVAFYLTPDGQHVIVGAMLDAQGENLTQAQLQRHLPDPSFAEDWSQLEDSHWIREGDAQAKRVIYAFSDPNCPYCHRLWQAMRPHIGSDIQVRHILVGILRPDSVQKSATILAARDPKAALLEHDRNFDKGGITPLKEIPAAAQQQTMANNQLMMALGVRGTPAVYYRDSQGEVRRIVGLPDDETLRTHVLRKD